MNVKIFLFIICASVFFTGRLSGQDTSYIGASASWNNDYWNDPTKWSQGVPQGATNAYIRSGITVTCYNNASTPTYTGDLIVSNNTVLQPSGSSIPAVYNMLGTPGSSTVYMHEGCQIVSRAGGTPNMPAISLLGNARMALGTSTATPCSPTFGYGISGPYSFTFSANNSSPNIYLTAACALHELVADEGNNAAGWGINANAAGSLGTNVTIKAFPLSGMTCADLTINAADAIADTGTLTLNGPNSTTRLTMNADDTIKYLFLDNVRQPFGTYGSNGHPSVDYPVSWLVGSGILTVTGNPSAYWDINGSTAQAGGASPGGSWSGSNWTTDPNGGAVTAAWSPGDTATFAAGSDAIGVYSVSVTATQDITGLVFEEGTVSVTGGTLEMSDDSYFEVASGITCTVSSVVSDDGASRQLAKSGSGALVLSGVNTYTGPTSPHVS